MNFNSLTIEELVDNIQAELTMSCALDKYVPDAEIRRLIEFKAMPYFYRNYDDAQQKAYFFIDQRAFRTEQYTKYKYLTLPNEVMHVVWTYGVGNHNGGFAGFSFGQSANGLDLLGAAGSGGGMAGMGETATYMGVIGLFADSINSMRKTTFKSDFNVNNKRFNVLTRVNQNLILECFMGIENEFLFADPLFVEYSTALGLIALGNLLVRITMPLPGNVQINGASIKEEGENRKKAVEEEIKGRPGNSNFFFNRR